MKRLVDSKDLKKLMKQQQQKSVQTINSPLAKYSSSGQLSCVVCGAPVKSDLLWTAHVISRQHKDRVAALKEQRATGAKRSTDAKQPESDGPLPKRSRDDDGGTTTQMSRATNQMPPPAAVPKKGILKNSRAIASGPSPLKPVAVKPQLTEQKQSSVDERMDTGSGVPDDFFDTSSASHSQLPCSSSSAASCSSEPGHASGSQAEITDDPEELPEGFFDDPVQDAKARHIEYRDPVEEEWARFQREMQSEVAAAAELLDEQQQLSTRHRQLQEADEQIRNLNRVVVADQKKRLHLQHLQQSLASSSNQSPSCCSSSRDQDPVLTADKQASDDDDEDEELLDELMNWRSKSSWK